MPNAITLTPEQEQEYNAAAAQVKPQPVNPLKDFDAATLADLATKDKTFNVVEEFRSKPDLHADPAIVQKAADALDILEKRGFKFSDLPSVKEAGGAVLDSAKGFGKQLWNYANVAGNVVGAAVTAPFSPGLSEGYAEGATERLNKNLAGTEEAMAGLSQLPGKAFDKAGRVVDAITGTEKTPAQKLANLWDKVGKSEVAQQRSTGQGPVMQFLNQGEATKQDPHEVAQLAAGDPLSFYAFGKATDLIGAGAKVAAVKVAPKLVEGISDVTAKVGAKAAEKLPEYAGNLIEGAGTLGKVAAEKLVQPAGKVLSVAGPVVGGVLAASGVDLTHAGLGGVLAGTAGVALKRAGQEAVPVMKGLQRAGQEIAGESAVTGAYTQATKDFLQALPSAAGQVAHGAAIDLGLAAATSESPQDTQGAAAFGTALGALHGAARVGGHIVSGQLIAPREYGINKTTPSSGQFKSFDAMTSAALTKAPPAVKARLNAVREFASGAAPGTDVFIGFDDASVQKALVDHGVPEATAKDWAQQKGFFTTDLKGKDGTNRRVIVLRDVDAAPHESFHAVQDVLGEAANQQIDKIVKDAYADRWDEEGQRYANRLSNAEGTWQEKLLDASGWGLTEAKEKLYRDIFNKFSVDNGTAPRPEMVKAEVTEKLGQLMDEAVKNNQHIPPNEISRHIWREVLSPDEAQGVADKYMARELAAENFDALFKHAGPKLNVDQGVIARLSQIVGKLTAAIGGDAISDRTSDMGNVQLKTPVVEAVRKVGQESLANVAPEVAAKLDIRSNAPTPIVPRGGSTPPPDIAAEEARQIAAEAPDTVPDEPIPAAPAPVTPPAAGSPAPAAPAPAPVAPPKRSSPREILGKVAEAIASRTGIKINYLSAPGEPAAATTSNRDTRRAIIEAFRKMPDEAKSLWEKTFFPDRVIKLKGDKYQILGWAPEVFAANAHKMAGFLADHAGISPYDIDPATKTFTPDGWKALYDDVQKFVQNQKAGQTGSGEPLVVPREMLDAGFTAPAKTGGGAGGLEQRKADFINLLFNFRLPDTARITGGKMPLNIAGQEISKATKPGRVEVPVEPRDTYTGDAAQKLGIEGRDIMEVNPLRNELEAAAKSSGEKLPSLIEAIQRLNLENIKEVEGDNISPEFRGNTLTLTAGFQPKPITMDDVERVKGKTHSYFISPKGEIFDAKDNHYKFIEDNRKMLGLPERGEDYMEKMHETMKQVTDAGWVRVNASARHPISAESNNITPAAKRTLEDMHFALGRPGVDRYDAYRGRATRMFESQAQEDGHGAQFQPVSEEDRLTPTVRAGGKSWTGKSHADAINSISKSGDTAALMDMMTGQPERGFTRNGEFISRQDAADHFLKQTGKDRSSLMKPDEGLHSEDLRDAGMLDHLDEAKSMQAQPERAQDEEHAPVFYSQLQKVVRDAKQDTFSAEQLANMVKNPKSAVKAEELKWSGLDDFLAGKEKVTKAEVLDFLKQNEIKLEEKTLGGESALGLNEHWEDLSYAFEDDYDYVGEITMETGHPSGESKPLITVFQKGDDIHVADGRGEPLPHQPKFHTLEEAKAWGMEQAKEAHAEEIRLQQGNSDNSLTKHSGYKIPGGENYRELLMQWHGLPDLMAISNKRDVLYAKRRQLRLDEELEHGRGGVSVVNPETGLFQETTPEKAAEMKRLSDAIEALDKEMIEAKKKVPDFRNNHWDEKNVLAHTRVQDMKTPEGERVLMAEEIQSDWHQLGRKKGYRDDSEPKNTSLEEKHLARLKEIAELMTKNFRHSEPDIERSEVRRPGVPPLDFTTVYPRDLASILERNLTIGLLPESMRPEVEEARRITTELRFMQEGEMKKEDMAPDAPFKSTWHELVFKRLLRMAAEEGYDRLGWVTGEQSADRYDLSKHLDSVVVSPSGSDNDFVDVMGYKNGERIVHQNDVPPDKLQDYIGKDLAKKALEDGVQEKGKKYEGLDLKVGGEGMQGFYDKMIPDFARKYAKKWGAEVKDIQVLTSINEYPADAALADRVEKSGGKETVHSINITPEMKASVLHEGQRQFQPKSAEAAKLEDEAAKHFGTTKSPFEAGYMLTDGTLLDFSGRNQASKEHAPDLQDTRNLDHREIGHVEGVEGDSAYAQMKDFTTKTGAIRMHYTGDELMLSMSHPPSPEQVRSLSDIAKGTKFVSMDLWSPSNDGGSTYAAQIDRPTPAKVKRAFREMTEGKEGIQQFQPKPLSERDIENLGQRSRSFWISPRGKIYDAGADHNAFLRDNPALFGLTPEAVKDADTRATFARRAGWARVNVGGGFAISFDGRMSPTMQRTLEDLHFATGKPGVEAYDTFEGRAKEIIPRETEGGRNEWPDGTNSAQFAPPKPNEEVRKIAEDYAKDFGLTNYKPRDNYAKLDEKLSRELADLYEFGKHDPTDKAVAASYDAFNKENEAQWDAIKFEGYTIEPWKGAGEPYKSSDAMREDVEKNKHLFYLPTDRKSFKGSRNNPMLKKNTGGMLNNDAFRAVHDFFGHAKEGFQFGPRGEFNAWAALSGLYSDAAQGALAAETLAQNSWTNYGPHMRDDSGNLLKESAKGYLKVADRPFAEQKAMIVPENLLARAHKVADHTELVEPVAAKKTEGLVEKIAKVKKALGSILNKIEVEPKVKAQKKLADAREVSSLKMKPSKTGFSKAWILPDGQVAQLGGMWHHDWLANDPQGMAVAKKYNVDVKPFSGTEDDSSRNDAMKKGFIRVNLDTKNGRITIEGVESKWPRLRGVVAKLAERNIDQIDNATVSLFDDKMEYVKENASKRLFQLDTDEEKMAEFPLIHQTEKRTSLRGLDGPQFFDPSNRQSQPGRAEVEPLSLPSRLNGRSTQQDDDSLVEPLDRASRN